MRRWLCLLSSPAASQVSRNVPPGPNHQPTTKYQLPLWPPSYTRAQRSTDFSFHLSEKLLCMPNLIAKLRRGDARRHTSHGDTCAHSSSLDSSSSSSSSSAVAAAAFLAGFFFFFLFLLFAPVDRAAGCSKIFKISSSWIFLSDFTFSRSKGGGAASLVMPFLVIAATLSDPLS